MVSAALPLPASSSSWEFIVPFPATCSSAPLDATTKEGQGGPKIKAKRFLKATARRRW